MLIVEGKSIRLNTITDITNKNLRIRPNNVSGIDNTTAFKTYLAEQYANGTPVTVWYVLATPETEQIAVPSGLTGTIEGYLTQSGTPTQTNPVYPIANGEKESGGTYSINTGEYIEAWEARDNQGKLLWGREDELSTTTGTLSFKGYSIPVKVKSLLGNGQQTSGTTNVPAASATVVGVEPSTDYAIFSSADFPGVAVGDKVNIVSSGSTHSLAVKKIDAQYVYVENEVV